MATVKFDHRVKYAKVWHPAHTAFDVADKDIPELKKLGCQVLSYNEAPAQPSTPPTDEAPESANESANESAGDVGEEATEEAPVANLREELLEYSVAELKEFAEERGIDLQGKSRKADIYNLIVATL